MLISLPMDVDVRRIIKMSKKIVAYAFAFGIIFAMLISPLTIQISYAQTDTVPH